MKILGQGKVIIKTLDIEATGFHVASGNQELLADYIVRQLKKALAKCPFVVEIKD